MKNLFRLIVFVLLVGGWGLAAMSLHIVRTPTASREFIIVPKNRIGIQDTYVDTRAWTLNDASNHPGVVKRMIDTDKYMALAHVTGETEPAEVQQKLADAAVRGPQPKMESTKTPAKKVERAPEAKARKRKSNAKRQVAVR
ncbi:MAG TPA: hypothetical protein VGR35_08865 [Tepidisphaeraceae bacterium]|nr:hypothetical protein [Tepidisphaeraceae bacterium]